MPAPIIPDKAALRRTMCACRRALPADERRALSLAAQEHILRDPAWRKAPCVALYVALAEETDTSALLEEAWASGKTVLLPRCSPVDRGHMDFFSCAGRGDLRPGPFGIDEPDPDRAAGANIPPPSLMIVPGVAFDSRGFRLGMGGGYYDRFSSRDLFAGALRLGLAFAFQVADRVPREDWDLLVQAICTEKGLLWLPRP